MDGSKPGGRVRKLSFRPDRMWVSTPAPALAGARRFQHGGFREVREVREDSSPNYEPTFFKKEKAKIVCVKICTDVRAKNFPNFPHFPVTHAGVVCRLRLPSCTAHARTQPGPKCGFRPGRPSPSLHSSARWTTRYRGPGTRSHGATVPCPPEPTRATARQ
jgi:hypothetical protein